MERTTAKAGTSWLVDGLHPTLRDETAKDGAPERFRPGSKSRGSEGKLRRFTPGEYERGRRHKSTAAG
jgi:hypothetical protein